MSLEERNSNFLPLFSRGFRKSHSCTLRHILIIRTNHTKILNFNPILSITLVDFLVLSFYSVLAHFESIFVNNTSRSYVIIYESKRVFPLNLLSMIISCWSHWISAEKYFLPNMKITPYIWMSQKRCKIWRKTQTGALHYFFPNFGRTFNYI